MAACSAWRCFCSGGTNSVQPYWKFATAIMLITLKRRISQRLDSRPGRMAPPASVVCAMAVPPGRSTDNGPTFYTSDHRTTAFLSMDLRLPAERDSGVRRSVVHRSAVHLKTEIVPGLYVERAETRGQRGRDIRASGVLARSPARGFPVDSPRGDR